MENHNFEVGDLVLNIYNVFNMGNASSHFGEIAVINCITLRQINIIFKDGKEFSFLRDNINIKILKVGSLNDSKIK